MPIRPSRAALRRHLSVIATTCLLAACAHTGSQKAPDNPYTAAQLGLAAGQTAAVEAQWWRQLQQPVLNQLMTQALAQAPDLRVAEARLHQAEAQWRGSRGEGGLQVGAGISGNGFYLSPKPDASRIGENGSHVFTTAAAMLQASYAFDFWGKQKNTIQAALGRRTAAALQTEQARLLLAQAVVAQYTQWQRLNEQQAVLAKRIAVNEAGQKLLAVRAQAGLIPASAVYPQQQALLQWQAAQQAVQAETARVRHSLAALSGQAPDALANTAPSPLGNTPAVAVGSLKADILGQRPDIAAQRALLQSRRYSVAAAKAEFYPNIEIKGLAGFAHIDAFDLLSGNSRFAGLMPAISLPIFTSGSLQANLAAKNAQYDEQVAVYDQTVLAALQQAADAVSQYQSSRAALPLQQQAWQVAQKRAAASARRVRAGLDNGIIRLQQEDAALAAHSDYLDAAAGHQQAWNQLQAALGGGFQAAQGGDK